jgi:hypothetical protein
MSNRFCLQPAVRWTALIVLLAFVDSASAQWLSHPTPGIPRTADGKPNLTAPAPRTSDGKPDLTGLWTRFTPRADLKLSDAQPWVRALMQERRENFGKDNPRYRCLPDGPTSLDPAVAVRRILQTPVMIVILYDDLTYRQIFTDGRELESDPNPSWMGYSVGHWDGDTLIVDSIGFNDRTWLAGNFPHTEALRMTERYRRVDFGHLTIEATLQDSGAYTRPWSFHMTARLAADTEMLDARCDPADNGRNHWIGNLSDAQKAAVKLAPEVLGKYVGVYEGVWAGAPRVVEMTLSGGVLFVSISGGERQPLIPQSETIFSGTALGYKFVLDKSGVATGVIEMHVSGDYELHRRSPK